MKRRTVLLGGGALTLGALASSLPAIAQDAKPEKTDVTLGVGGKPLLYYLPLTIAEKKGFFEEQGLNVTINDFAGGSKSLQALIGGSVDMVTGAYEHTIRMQHKGQDIVGVCNMGRFPGIVIGVRKDIAGEVKSVADLKGRTMGVTAPGSSTSLMLQYALLKNGLEATDVSLVGVGGGAGAVAAIKQKQVEGLSHLDPVIAQLQYDGDIEVLLDTRTEAGTRELFGGPNPAATLYTTAAFTNDNPVTTQRLVNGMLAALKWLQTASADEVADAVPEEYLLGNRDLYKQAFENSKEMYSPDGVVSKEGYDSMMAVLKTLDPELANADVPYEKTFDARFVTAA
ncbi:amino acid ABC transporter [Nitratireductor indicus C115]|uniref:Amino acid ABC transporter n=1 Tax=Nitratireductor indicus C115 TaxID=1231190 RepID=K2NYP4_9HYPH|nr:ABC transporter substrate-binding protein [Nitratireductor indicus]EKF42989.1 amino acid ABC transporter [Nitratireductor indicus C115]SFQ51755.1 NitT/TauT family transport system substrate-binding protein [Nitratireductor indicus]